MEGGESSMEESTASTQQGVGSVQAPQYPGYGTGRLSVGMNTAQPPVWPMHPRKGLHTGMGMWAQHCMCVQTCVCHRAQQGARGSPSAPKGCLSVGYMRPKPS